MNTLQEKIRMAIQATGMTVIDIARATELPVESMYKWVKGAIPRNPLSYNKLVAFLDDKLLNTLAPNEASNSIGLADRSLFAFLGRIDQIVEVWGNSMLPTFKPASLLAIKSLLDPQLLNWSECYYIVDNNGEGTVKRVYASEQENSIILLSDNPDQERYPPIIRSWSQITAIYKVKAEIIKH